MERSEFMRRLVLNEISNDYENVDQCILRHAAVEASRCGLTINRAEVVAALTSLVEAGLAKAYVLPDTTELIGMPPLDMIVEDFKTYFYITKKGMEVHLADDDWFAVREGRIDLA